MHILVHIQRASTFPSPGRSADHFPMVTSADASLNEASRTTAIGPQFSGDLFSRHFPKHRPSFSVTVHKVHLMIPLRWPFYSDLL